MLEASEEMEFEKAIEYRELLNSVTKIAQKQKITSSDMEDKDVIAMSVDQHDAVVQVFFIRDGRLIGRDHFACGLQTGTAGQRYCLLLSSSFTREPRTFPEKSCCSMRSRMRYL